MTHESYVSKADWAAPAGRADLIDEIADQFERRAAGSQAFWDDLTVRRTERESRLAPQRIERRAG